MSCALRDRAGNVDGQNRGVQEMAGHRVGGYSRDDFELMPFKLGKHKNPWSLGYKPNLRQPSWRP